ncbi:MAG TPA: hypothetical protein VFV67_06135 [Actinophytocola sp.]|uniref:hypothetical protein n=1 Tax=Actinophytocola sp. TaxID=1872138 RepID=UPI002DBFC7C6|nr:hypothetical protein [Actinophytocola sp.]HEU5470212.1 hypothetical protein [Actinophytocola sp.]
MAFEEKRTWIMLVMAIVTYVIYAIIVLGRIGDYPISELPYAATLLWTLGISIVVSIVLTMVAGITSPKGDVGRDDPRDREISRFGDHIGSAFVVIGAVAALAMAMLEWDYFWIANEIYLMFTLSAVLGSVAKIAAYRKGLHPW